MPFDRSSPRAFNNSSIREHAPARSGVYGISNAHEWLYVGEADDIRAALLVHLQAPGGELGRRGPTGFVFELCDSATRSRRQDRLVLEYGPICNRLRTQAL